MGFMYNLCDNRTCVQDIVKEIIVAQHYLSGSSDCSQSTMDLSCFLNSRHLPKHSIIPFTLICKGTCRTFVGFGMTADNNLDGVESPVFKANRFVNESNDCVQLELLLPVYKMTPITSKDYCIKRFDDKHIQFFSNTGVCITVDLNNFCGITCLAPITPISF